MPTNATSTSRKQAVDRDIMQQARRENKQSTRNEKTMKIEKGIKNIIFDLGGVLVGLDKNRCVEAFRKIGADDIAYFVDEHRVESLFFDSEVGNISQAVFCQRVRELTKKDIPDKDIVWAWNELLTGIPDFKKECLLRLNNYYRLFLLSNTNVMHWTKCAQDFFPFHGWGVNDYFEQVFLSYEMHLIKPSEEIFKSVLDEAGIMAEQTLFVDDSADNCRAAREVGIKTFLNEKPDDFFTR